MPPHRSPHPNISLKDRYERYEGLHVLRLSGTDYEMGFQHGALLREAIPHGPLPYFSKYVRKVLTGALPAPAAHLAGRILGRTVGKAIARQFPPSFQEALNGLADGARISRRQVHRAVTMPETYLWVLSKYRSILGASAAPRFGVPLMGCSSALAWGSATADGSLLHGRNFDYQGIGYWDREQAVVFHRPVDGQSYVSITSAGILLGGITAMNTAGLTMVIHQHMSARDFDLGGLPVGVVGDRIMRHAKTLDEARNLLDQHHPNGPWTYVVGSAKEQAVLCYEVTAKQRACFISDGPTFGYSNIFLHRQFQGNEVFFYPTYWRNNTARYRRICELLEHQPIDSAHIAAILGNPGQPPCRFEDSIALLSTVGSVVFDANRSIAYVATGKAPVSQNDYVAFGLAEQAPRPDLPPLQSNLPDTTRAAFDVYRQAFEADFNNGDPQTAQEHLHTLTKLQPHQPSYHFVSGLLALRRRNAELALQCFERAIALEHP
ncbi:MAG: hypothetical protein HN348_32520, partial [Proteobacteria bacterium]|nr:hypothetical protein [Pseudomonadota bacterium]